MKERPMALPCSLFKHSPLEVAEGLREPNTARKRNTNEKIENLLWELNLRTLNMSCLSFIIFLVILIPCLFLSFFMFLLLFLVVLPFYLFFSE